jgi:magnesium chelatase subunit I
LVGQEEMKLALVLGLINPAIGGVLLLGPRGTGKTTAVRSLLDILPQVEHSTCFYGCLPQDILDGGMDAVCPDCARKYAQGDPLTVTDRVRLVELPLNAALDDVIGGLDDCALVHQKVRLKKGLLAQADQNLLYIDEVNMLSGEVIDAILDAAAQGSYTVRRGPVSATYRSRFLLVGSMNPEEGHLRSQIMDRFGLRVLVKGLDDPHQRLEAYRRVQEFQRNPRQIIEKYRRETQALSDEIREARQFLPEVILSDEVAREGIALVQKMKIDSLRAEITLFEAARAHAAAEKRTLVTRDDLKVIAPLALRLRRSEFMQTYLTDQTAEASEILQLFESIDRH